MLFYFLILISSLLGVFANTEIVNFSVNEPSEELAFLNSSWTLFDVDSPSGTYKIPPASFGTPLKQVCPEGQGPCPHELWFALALGGDWQTYHKFTLRVSYPASYPADFRIDLYNPPPSHPTSDRTVKYARIRVVHTGVLTPSPTSAQHIIEPVPFNLILEPLYFGVLPASLTPVIAYLVILAGTAYFSFPWIHRYLQTFAETARSELSAKAKGE